MPILHENEVHTAFLTVYNKLQDHKDMILKPMLEQLLEAQSKTMFTKPEITELHNQIANLTRQNHSLRSVSFCLTRLFKRKNLDEYFTYWLSFHL